VGAVIVNEAGEIIGEGFNFLPRPDLPTARVAEHEEDTKYPYGIHKHIKIDLN